MSRILPPFPVLAVVFLLCIFTRVYYYVLLQRAYVICVTYAVIVFTRFHFACPLLFVIHVFRFYLASDTRKNMLHASMSGSLFRVRLLRDSGKHLVSPSAKSFFVSFISELRFFKCL